MNIASLKPLKGKIGIQPGLKADQDSHEPSTAIERAREQFKVMMARRRAQKSIARD